MKAVKTVCSIILLMGSILSSHSMVGTFDVNSYELCSVTASSRVWLKGSLSTPQKRSLSQPISVLQQECVLNISYLCGLGEVLVTISNVQGSVIYNEMVTVSERGNTSINLDQFEKVTIRLLLRMIRAKSYMGHLVFIEEIM